MRLLFPTILSCDIASPYFFMTIIQELRTRVCTENLIRVDAVMESLKLAE